jgi:antitoxin YefM
LPLRRLSWRRLPADSWLWGLRDRSWACAILAAEHAIILYMTTLPLGEARAQLSKLVDSAEHTHERFDITRNGRRAAVLLAADDYDAMRETIEILSDPNAMAQLREAKDDVARGRTEPLEEVVDELRRSGRI